MSKKTMLILGALAAAYFIFGKKTTTAAHAPTGAMPNSTNTLAQTVAATAGDIFKLGSSVASELKGMDGVAHASLEGHMASVGAYGDLGGTFYGAY